MIKTIIKEICFMVDEITLTASDCSNDLLLWFLVINFHHHHHFLHSVRKESKDYTESKEYFFFCILWTKRKYLHFLWRTEQKRRETRKKKSGSFLCQNVKKPDPFIYQNNNRNRSYEKTGEDENRSYEKFQTRLAKYHLVFLQKKTRVWSSLARSVCGILQLHFILFFCVLLCSLAIVLCLLMANDVRRSIINRF